MKYIDLARRFDPLKVAVEYGRERRLRRSRDGALHQFQPSAVCELLARPSRVSRADARLGKRSRRPASGFPVKPYKRTPYSRVLSFAYPEVRTFYVSFFKQLASTGTKGIMIDLLRHPPIAGYEPIVSEAFKKKYGKDMEPLDIYNDPQIQEHLSEYLRLFLVELREAIGDDIEISVRCSGPNNFALRGKEWIDAGLINTIVDGHWYSGNGPRPTIDATVAAVGTRGKAMAAAEMSRRRSEPGLEARKGVLSPDAIEALAKAYSGRGVAAFGLYESTVHTWSPDARRAIRAAGWNYDPRKTTGAKAP